jgi:hypothetical protein
VLVLWKRSRQAAIMAATAMPALLGWIFWSSAHRAPALDMVAMYYTDYVALYLHDVTVSRLGLMLWKNSSQMLVSFGQLIIFNLADNAILMNISRVLGIASCVGIARMWRANRSHPYYLCLAGLAGMLLVWNYPPDLRFLVPFYPLVIAGFLSEVRFLVLALKATWARNRSGDRPVTVAFAGAITAILAIAIVSNLYGAFVRLPGHVDIHRRQLAQARPGYDWIKREAPKEAGVFSFNDPILYLYTGHHSISLPFPSSMSYDDRWDQIREYYLGVKPFAEKRGLSLVWADRNELDAVQMRDEDRPDVFKAMTSGPSRFHAGNVTVMDTAALNKDLAASNMSR